MHMATKLTLIADRYSMPGLNLAYRFLLLADPLLMSVARSINSGNVRYIEPRR